MPNRSINRSCEIVKRVSAKERRRLPDATVKRIYKRMSKAVRILFDDMEWLRGNVGRRDYPMRNDLYWEAIRTTSDIVLKLYAIRPDLVPPELDHRRPPRKSQRTSRSIPADEVDPK